MSRFAVFYTVQNFVDGFATSGETINFQMMLQNIIAGPSQEESRA